MTLNPPTQYMTDANLRARQRLWEHQQPPFDLVSWVLEVAGLRPGSTARVLDVGCGNGSYLMQLRTRRIDVVGCDLSIGMLVATAAAAAHDAKLVNADVARLPFMESAFDVVLAPHMLYHVSDRQVGSFGDAASASATRKMRRRNERHGPHAIPALAGRVGGSTRHTRLGDAGSGNRSVLARERSRPTSYGLSTRRVHPRDRCCAGGSHRRIRCR